MKRRVILTPAAQADRRRTRSWFRQPGSGLVARARLAALEAAIAALAGCPTVNRFAPAPGVRLLIAQRHRVPYEILPDSRGGPEGGDVVVLRIYGPGQNDD